jgi:hypothetical protein
MQFPAEIVNAILQSVAFLTQTQHQSQSNITSIFEGETPGGRALQSMVARDLQGASVRRHTSHELAPSLIIAKKTQKKFKISERHGNSSRGRF